MFRNFILIIIIILLCTLLSCIKNSDENSIKGDIEFYLLKSFDTLDNTFRIDITSVQIEHSALISYDELLKYNPSTCTFSITNEAANRIKNLHHSVRGLGFAVVANSELIYTGYFWPMYSSLVCDWINVDPIDVQFTSKMTVRLDYHGPPGGMSIPDLRNDPRIINILKRDKKLVSK
jgi:hypothetical protein